MSENTAKIVDWEKEDQKKKSDSNYTKLEYLTLKGNGPFKVRFVGDQVKFLKYGDPFNFRDNVITDDSYGNEDPAKAAGLRPKVTYASFVFDRDDGNKLKILERSGSIFTGLINYSKTKGKKPGAKDANDFIIMKSNTNTGNKMDVRYSINWDDLAPLTEEEAQLYVTEVLKNEYRGKDYLAKRYKPTPLEKIKELWEAIPEEDKEKALKARESDTMKSSVTKSPASKPQPPQKKVVSDADALFNSDSEEEVPF